MMMIIAVKKASISIYQSRAWRQEGSNRESVKSMHEHLTGGQAGRRQAVGKGSPFTRQEAGNAEVALLGIRLVDSSLSISKAWMHPTLSRMPYLCCVAPPRW